jgi:hypothetical protein
MVILSLALKALTKIDEQKDRAVDNLIERTKYHGMPGSGHVGTQGGWGAVYKILKEQDHGRKTSPKAGQTKKSKERGTKAT